MNVTEIIKLAATYLQLEEVLDLEELGGEVIEPSDLASKNLELLTRCVNLVYQEIASDYLPLKHTETIVVENNQFLLANLTKSPINVLSVKNEREESVRYSIYPNCLRLVNGTYTIEYSYFPETVLLDDEMENFAGRLSERILAYGVASEYSFISGLFDEASMWKTRFSDSIKIASRKKSEVRIPPRRWL